jgi:hypothetical protein
LFPYRFSDVQDMVDSIWSICSIVSSSPTGSRHFFFLDASLSPLKGVPPALTMDIASKQKRNLRDFFGSRPSSAPASKGSSQFHRRPDGKIVVNVPYASGEMDKAAHVLNILLDDKRIPSSWVPVPFSFRVSSCFGRPRIFFLINLFFCLRSSFFRLLVANGSILPRPTASIHSFNVAINTHSHSVIAPELTTDEDSKVRISSESLLTTKNISGY